MEKNDNFNRTYPLPGFVLLLIITIVPTLVAVAFGFIALPKIQSSQNILMTMAYSAILALGCSLASIILGLPGAYLFTSYKFPLKSFFIWLFALVLFLPTTVLALFPQVLIGESGLLSLKLGKVVDIPYPWLKTGIVLTLFNVPEVIILISLWWSRIDNSIEKCASTLGIKKSSAFRHLTMPRLRPAIFGATSIVFLRSLSSMAVVMTTACGTPFINSASQIFNYAAAGDIDSAGVLALLTLLLSIVVAIPFISTISNSDLIANGGARAARKPSGLAVVGILIYLLLAIALLILPTVSIIYRSLIGEAGLTISAYTRIFGGLEALALKPLTYSALIALAVALVSTFMALRLTKSYTSLALLSFAIGSSVMGFGYSIISSKLTMVPGLLFAILSHIAVTVPVAVIILLPFMKAIPESLIETSKTLGYSSAYSFRKIDRKLVGKRVIAAFLISFIISFGEFGTSLFLKGKTLPVLIFSTADTDLSAASAMASVLIVVCSLLFVIAASLLKSKEGEQSV